MVGRHTAHKLLPPRQDVWWRNTFNCIVKVKMSHPAPLRLGAASNTAVKQKHLVNTQKQVDQSADDTGVENNRTFNLKLLCLQEQPSTSEEKENVIDNQRSQV